MASQNFVVRPGFDYKATGAGSVSRTAESKLDDIVNIKDYGAVGDGVTNDSVAMDAAKAAVVSQNNSVFIASNGEYVTPGTYWPNNVSPTSMAMTRPGVIGVFEGTQSNPDTNDRNPVLWAQKYTKYDSDGDRFAHNAGGVFGEINLLGTGQAGANDTEGTWIGVLGNAVISGTNQGTAVSPDYDAYGSAIGVAGFARATGYPGDGNIVTGTWGYAEGPVLDATTLANLPATNWSLVGLESNVQINHPDIGEQSILVGKGTSVGLLNFNFRTPGTGVKDWTFGIVYNGTPEDGDYTSTDIDNWNGFYCGILLDKIKAKGIRFGQYMKTGSYGIYFPDTYVGSQEPAAAIYLGNSKIAMGQYVGATFNNGDLWHNGGNLYYQYSSQPNRLIQHNEVTGAVPINNRPYVNVAASGVQFSIGDVSSSVNYLCVFGAATANTPALAAEGSDTDVDIELRPQGSGTVWIGPWTSSADQAVDGYIMIKDSSGNPRKIATIA